MVLLFPNLTRSCVAASVALILITCAGCGGGSFRPLKPAPAPTVQAVPSPGGTPGTTGGSGTPTPAPSPSTPIPSNAASYNNIQAQPGWQACTAKLNGSVCASGRGNAVFSMREGVSSPSMDGQAAQFSIQGPVPYSNALWWKELGGNDGAHNFSYDLYVYITQPNLPQSLEFDVNQSVSDKNLKFIFGTECDLQATHLWHNWDTAHARWVNTSVPCTPFQAFTWNHLVLQFQRTAQDKIVFVSVSINGQTHYFNKQFDPERVSASELNVAFQMDGNSRQAPYSVWLDKVTLKAW